MNNNGIYQGVSSEIWNDITEDEELPLRSLKGFLAIYLYF